MSSRAIGLLDDSRRLPKAVYLIGILLLAVPALNLTGSWFAYIFHIMVVILIWSFAYTSWSLMGRFGLVSLGHGAFMAVGAYGTALLWNYVGLTPWIGIPVSVAAAGLLAFIVGYPSFRFRIVGHYFALVTLALTEVIRQVLNATRDYTGGSLGFTPNPVAQDVSIYERILAIQFADRTVFYYAALVIWAFGLYIWWRVDKSMDRYALDAISEDEDAAASAGIWVTREKLKITITSAMMTALAGALYCQYQQFIAPDTVGGITISLQIVFAVVAGGIYVILGPTFGAIITITLTESLRIAIGTSMVGLDTTIYGLLLVLFIIFLPKGIVGGLMDWWQRRRNNGLPKENAAETD